MSKNRRRVLAVLAVSALVAGLGTSGASALSNPTWWSLCAGYSGNSWYSMSGTGYAATTASDNDKVGAAVRYYAGRGAYVQSNHRAVASRTVAPTGGYHQ